MRKITFAIATIAGAAIALNVHADLIFSNWVGPAAGNWNVAGNWNPAVIPQNGTGGNTYVVRIDNNTKQNSTVTHTAGTTALDGLIIDAGDTLIQNNNTHLELVEFATINNIWQMSSLGNGTDFRVIGAEVSLNGSGVLSMSNNFQNRIFGTAEVRRLINGPNSTIRGSGQIGANTNLKLTNNGLIDATQSNDLRIDLTDGLGNFNNGIMQSSASGNLHIFGTSIENENGIIRAIDSSLTRLEASTILDGELRTEGTGEMRIQGTTTLQDVTVNGILTQPNNQWVNLINGITVNGEWRMNSLGNGTDVRLDSDVTVTTTGGGDIVTSNNIQNRFYGINALRRLTLDTNTTIRGSGQLGVNTDLKLTNNGLINATQSQPLTVDLTDGLGNFNNGVMQSSIAGDLNINGTTIENENGVISAIGNGLTRLTNSSIIGGELRTEDVGEMRIQGVTTLQDVTVNGILTQPNNQWVNLINGITVNGEWRMNSLGNGTDVRLDSNATISSTSTADVVMSNNIQNRILGINAERRLTLASNTIIRGSGQLGVNTNLKLTNNGLINATQSQSLTVDLTDGSGNLNNGVMQSSSSGNLIINGTTIENENGVISAVETSLTRLTNSTVIGGELRTEDAGEMRIQGVTTLQDVTVNGILTQPNDQWVNLINGITVNGEWRLNSAGNGTDIRLESDATITSTDSGDVVLSNNIQNRILGVGAVRHLTLATGTTIRGSGQIGVNTNLGLTNHGSIIANQTQPITIDLTDGETFLNTGLLRVTGAGAMTIQPSGMNQQGQVLVDATRTLTRSGHYTQTAGTTTVNGTLAITGSGNQLQLQSGVLNGTGNITTPTGGSVLNSGGSVEPGSSAGILTVTGAYTQGNAGKLRIEIGGLTPGTEHDRLTVTGAATLAGTIEIVLADKYQPSVGDTFTVLTAGTLNGQFRAVDAPSGMGVIYQGNTVVVNVIQTPCAADVTFDGLVNANDLLAVINGWGACTNNPCPPSCVADVTNDCVVNANDLLAVINNWGACQ